MAADGDIDIAIPAIQLLLLLQRLRVAVLNVLIRRIGIQHTLLFGRSAIHRHSRRRIGR